MTQGHQLLNMLRIIDVSEKKLFSLSVAREDVILWASYIMCPLSLGAAARAGFYVCSPKTVSLRPPSIALNFRFNIFSCL